VLSPEDYVKVHYLPSSILIIITAVMLIMATVVAASAQEPRHIEIRIINPTPPEQAPGDAPTRVTRPPGPESPGRGEQRQGNAPRKVTRTPMWESPEREEQPQDNAVTKVTVIGNRVLVPVTLVYQDNEVDVQLVLDTGAGGTVIHKEIADLLHVDLSTERKTRSRVAGGAYIEGHQVNFSRITVGPHTKENPVIYVIEFEGPAANHDGLLGMDVLRALKYSVDFEKQIITWEKSASSFPSKLFGAENQTVMRTMQVEQ
jgi:predicted aspartyl protease